MECPVAFGTAHRERQVRSSASCFSLLRFLLLRFSLLR